jgi:hypothetical protein
MADYAITNVARRVVYTGSAGVGPYAFSFPVLVNTDIAVYKNTTLLTLTTDYTVTISGSTGTGSITLVVAATGADQITIVGARAIQRSTDFVTGGDFFANTLNTELDSEVIFTQQIAETAERALKAPVTDPTSIDMTLPAKATRAGKYLSFNSSTGNPEVVNSVTNINTIAGIAADVTTVSGISANVTAVAGNAANVTTVATNIANVNATGGNIANVNSVAGNATNINAVNSNSTNINTVATNIANVNATGASIANVNAVGSDLLEAVSEINTVANNIANVNTVGGSIASVTTVATDIANVNTAATNIADINNASTNAATATTKAGEAAASASAASASASAAASSASSASSSASSANTSASNAAASYDSFDDRYLGAKSSAPGTDNDGNALITGALYWNTPGAQLYAWDGSAWSAAAFSASGAVSSFNTRSGAVTLSGTDVNNAIAGANLTAIASVAVTADPTTALQLATKQYVDSIASGLHVHGAVDAATTAALSGTVTYANGTSGVGATLTLGTALTTLDGYTLLNGDRVLVKNQANEAHNGIYTWATGGTVLTRATDADTPLEFQGGDFFFVVHGTVNGDTSWAVTTEVTTIGTSNVTFAQISGAGTYTAGTGLTLTGTQFSINTGTTVDLSTAQTLTNKTLTSPTLTTPALGTPASGTLTNATGLPLTTGVTGTLPVANGGTGATTLSAAEIATLGYTTTATAAGTTTLTVSSTANQFFTGTTTQTVVLPVVSTLTRGQQFTIHNNSTGIVTVNSSGSNLVATVTPNTTAVITCILITGTTAASWDADFTGFTTALATARGGTGLTAIGTANQVLKVNAGATALEYGTVSSPTALSNLTNDIGAKTSITVSSGMGGTGFPSVSFLTLTNPTTSSVNISYNCNCDCACDG